MRVYVNLTFKKDMVYNIFYHRRTESVADEMERLLPLYIYLEEYIMIT